MDPIPGVGGADFGSNYDDDQADSGSSQQVHALPGDVLVGVATDVATTVAAVSTITTTSSAVATSVSTSTVVATSVGKGSSGDRDKKGKGPASKRCASDAAFSSATTSVGKGSSGDRGKKGKGPASKRCAAGSTVSTTAVHSASAGASSELADSSSSGAAEYCGFHICTSDLLDLRRMEGSFLCALEEKATAFFRPRIQESPLLRDDSVMEDFSDSVMEDFSELRDVLFSGLEADMSGFREKYFAEVHSRVIFSHHLVGGEIKKFSTEEASQFRESFLTAIAAKIREYLALVWRLEVSMALDEALCASHSAQVAAARAAASTAASVARAVARAAAPIPDTNPDPARARARALAVVRATKLRARRAAAACPTIDPVVARARAAACARAADYYASTADYYAKTVAARAAAAQAHAAVADRFVAQARAVDSSVPSSGSNSSLVLDNLVATALNNRAAARAADAEAAAAAAAAARAHAFVFAPIPDTDPDPTSTRNRARYRLNTASNRARTAATLAAAARAVAVAADRAVDQARDVGNSVSNPGSGSVSDHTLDNLVAAALARHEDARLADARARAAAAVAARAHAAIPLSSTDPDFVRARACARAANGRAHTAAALAAAARFAAIDADRVVAQARAEESSAPNLGSGSGSGHIPNSFVAVALTHHEDARLADARARVAAAAAARAHAAVPPSNTDPNFVRARARAHIADNHARTAAALAAAARVAAIDADRAVAQASAADGRAPDPGPDSNLVIANVGAAATTATCSVSVASTTDYNSARTSTAAIAGSSTSSLLPDTSSPVPPGFVDLFGFVVPSELSDVVRKLISDVCAVAKSFYPGTLGGPLSRAVRSLSNSEQRCAWCLTNMKLYEAKFMAKCIAEYFVKLLPEFIKHLCNVRVWDSSSHCLLPLMGSRLRDFWASLDQAIFRALRDFFVTKWTAFTARFSVPVLLSSVPGEVSSALCGGDFVGACAKAATSSSSRSIFGSITGGMGLQVAPHAGDSVSLFGFELPSEVGEMVEVLIREISAFARRTYSSLVGVQVLDAMGRLSDSEKCAWLTASMMLYKAGFVANCLTGYSDELCSDFICSIFSARHGDASGRSLLPLMGNNLRDFWLSLGNAILEAVEGIFVAEWGEFTRLVPLESREESSSTVCGRDLINACNKAGIPT
ncbi:hypothetical protein, partial [Candidatus Ichthyocystis sparus]|uniref:hypothetical protein n=1 Tax=Candidatus Ichthyocystis sparus TaxID=1561004 RepID=UPI000B8382E9